MLTIYNLADNSKAGTITDAEYQFLAMLLEEDRLEDSDYYINRDTIAMLQDAGATLELIQVLTRAIAATGEADIRWVRE